MFKYEPYFHKKAEKGNREKQNRENDHKQMKMKQQT